MKGGIKITCSCGKQIEVPPAMAGLNIRCRKCWNTMRVPLPDGTPLPDRRSAERRSPAEQAPYTVLPENAVSSEAPAVSSAAAADRRRTENRRWTDRRSTPVVDPDAARLHRRMWAKGSEAVKSSFLAKAVLVLAILGAAFCVYMAVRSFSREAALEPLRPYLPEYLSAGGKSAAKPVNIFALKGRVVVVDMDKKDFDPIFFNLPARIRAEKHEGVGTVVQVKKDGADWTARFIDFLNGRETLYKRFNPGKSSEKPADAIAKFISDLRAK